MFIIYISIERFSFFSYAVAWPVGRPRIRFIIASDRTFFGSIYFADGETARTKEFQRSNTNIITAIIFRAVKNIILPY